MNYQGDRAATIAVESRRRALKERQDNLLADIHAMESALHLRRRWQPEDSEYQATLKYMATRKYQKALGHLQRLVVQRLFELHKLNLSGTGKRPRSIVDLVH